MVDVKSKIQNPLSAIRHPPSTIRNPLFAIRRPRAFTLIEMLIVVTIIMMLVAAALTTMRPALESRRIREAARAIDMYLGSARNRAMETGRPCGVMFRCFRSANGTIATTPPCVMNADQCEVPPCYCGDTYQSTASVVNNNGTLTVTLNSDTPSNLLKIGDMVQFNCQGPQYPIIAPTPYDPNTSFVIATQPGNTWVLTCDYWWAISAVDCDAAAGDLSRLPFAG